MMEGGPLRQKRFKDNGGWNTEDSVSASDDDDAGQERRGWDRGAMGDLDRSQAARRLSATFEQVTMEGPPLRTPPAVRAASTSRARTQPLGHRAKVAQGFSSCKIPVWLTVTDGDKGGICAVCDKTLSTNHSLEQHLVGKAHRDKLRASSATRARTHVHNSGTVHLRGMLARSLARSLS